MLFYIILKTQLLFHYFQSVLMLLTFKTHVQRMILLCAVTQTFHGTVFVFLCKHTTYLVYVIHARYIKYHLLTTFKLN